MNYQYSVISGSYYLFDLDSKPNPITKEREIILMTDQIAIAFDRSDGTLHKHGNPKNVELWRTQAIEKFRKAGFDDMANDLIIMIGQFPLEEINKCISTSGYCKTLYEKLNTLPIEGKSNSRPSM